MKNWTFWVLAVMWMAMIFFVMPRMNQSKPPTPPPAKQVFQKAEAAEKAAGNNKKKLGAAVKDYSKLQEKQYRNSEYAAQAQLRIALIYDTKLNDNRRAVTDYVKILRDHPASTAIGRVAQERAEVIDKGESAKAGYKLFDALVTASGRNRQYSCALALFLITLVFKLVTTPLSHAQFKGMREMQKVAPLVKQIQEKYKGNQQEIGKRTMDLYKEHGINPLSSCLPVLAQMPILIALYYWVIVPYTYQFSKGEFLWIGSSLAAKWPLINILGKQIPGFAANLALPDLPLLIVYTISMIISQKLSAVDPSQAEQQKIMAWTMPIVFAFIFMSFPSALMFYWLTFNVIGTAQQYQIMRHPSNGGPTLPPTVTNGDDQPKDPPKRPPVSPGKKSKRRKRHFDALPIAIPIPKAV